MKRKQLSNGDDRPSNNEKEHSWRYKNKNKLREKEEMAYTHYFKMMAMKYHPREPRVSHDSQVC